VLGVNIETKLFNVKKGDESATTVPMIDCRARGENSTQAHEILTTWIAVFLKQTKELIKENSQPSINMVEQVYKTNLGKLNQLEVDNKTATEQFEIKQRTVEKRWNETISAFNLETQRKLATFENETDQLVSDLRLESDLPGMDARIAALSRTLSDLNLGVGADHLTAPRIEDAQPINRSGQLSSIAEQLTTLQNQQLKATTALAKLQRDRQVNLEELKNTRTLALAELTANQKQELDDLIRTENLRKAQISREIGSLNEMVKILLESYNQAEITKSQHSTQDIQISSTPTIPEQPLPRGALKSISLFAFLGALLGFGFALARTTFRRINKNNEVLPD
jgi:hypothetical protein